MLGLPGWVWTSWSLPLLPFISCVLAAVIYLRGWQAARRTRPAELPRWRMACFLGGLAWFWLAIASPIDALDDYLLAGHMIQHFILMSVAPPLIVLGAPTVPTLRGLPRSVVRAMLGPFFRMRWTHRAADFIMHPAVLWLAMNTAYIAWHTPPAFELTFRSESVHDLEHLCFFITSLGFWWVVLAPWPSRVRWPRWTVIPYLLLADMVNTMLSAFLAFCGRVVYPSYAAAERITRLTALQDQIAAGSEMWILNSIVMVAPAMILTLKLLSPKLEHPADAQTSRKARSVLAQR